MVGILNRIVVSLRLLRLHHVELMHRGNTTLLMLKDKEFMIAHRLFC